MGDGVSACREGAFDAREAAHSAGPEAGRDGGFLRETE